MDTLVDTLAITLIITALAEGASGAVEVNQDTYQNLKTLVQHRIGDKPEALFILDRYEEKPDIWKGPLRDLLEQVHADQDKEIIKISQNLMAATESRQADVYERVNTVRLQLERTYRQARKQARVWFFLSTTTSVVIFLLVFFGTAMLFAGLITPGTILVIASGGGGAMEIFLFQRLERATDRVDAVREALVDIDSIKRTMALVSKTDDRTIKNEIFSRALQLSEKEREKFSLSSHQSLIDSTKTLLVGGSC